MRPLVLSVADLLHRPAARRHEHLRVPLAGVGVTAAGLPPGAEVDVDVLLEAVADGVLVSGTVSAPWEGECRRCLGIACGSAVVAVRELFEQHPTEGDTWPLRHDQVDLEPLVREAVVLELPLAPLCREDCQGLCPICGADRNDGSCGCAPDDRDPRWAALDALRTESES